MTSPVTVIENVSALTIIEDSPCQLVIAGFTPPGPPGPKGDAASTIVVGSTTTGAAGSSATVTNVGTLNDVILNFTIPRGNTGAAATVALGTVSTGMVGSDVVITNSGTSSAAILNFTIPRGDVGQDGAPGAPGSSATIAVGSTTTLDAGSPALVTNVGTSGAAILNFAIPMGSPGVKGDKGNQGDPGAAATVSVGSTTTIAAGSSASVTNSGTSGAAVLNFNIPQGAKGDIGTAATVTVGSTTTGAAGSSATVTNTGTSSAAVLAFSIPQGIAGTPGAAATVSVGTVTTGAAGSSATVTNTGTSNAAVLAFTIPRGDTGATGPGLPTAGVAGQLPTKVDSTNYNTVWKYPAPQARRISLTNGWYHQPDYAFVGSQTNTAFSSATVVFSSFSIGFAGTITEIGVKQIGAASASYHGRLGLYSSDPTTGLPKTLLADGQVTLNASGNVLLSLSVNVAITPGIYWVCFEHDYTSTVSMRAYSSASMSTIVGADDLSNSTVSLGYSNASSTYVAAGFPATWSGTLANTGSGGCILMYIKGS